MKREKQLRGFRQAYDDLRCRAGYVDYPGAEEYPLGGEVSALPRAKPEKIFE